MQSPWIDILFAVAITVPFAILWWLSGKLDNSRVNGVLWDSYFRKLGIFRLFSAETADTHREAEYTDEFPVGIMRARRWLVRALLVALYLAGLLIWIDRHV